MKDKLPASAARAISMLRAAGFEAVAVGGCVRDLLRGVAPHDWDLATSATPEEMLEVFASCRVILTGLRHGTLTVLIDQIPIEITTYRADSVYSDGRHPDAVRFSRSLREDLSRRDFTVNALALSPDGEIVDLFGGQRDLSCKILRAVGDPDRRFAEDGLRILRGLRFAAQLGFVIEPDTADSLRQNAGRLAKLSAERVRDELTRLLCAPDCARVLLEDAELLQRVLWERMPGGAEPAGRLRLQAGWSRGAQRMPALPALPALRWAALLCAAGAEEAGRLLAQLKGSNALRARVCRLIEEYDRPLLPERTALRRRLADCGSELVLQLLALQRADAAAGAEDGALALLDAAGEQLSALLDECPALGLDTLAVDGRALLGLGIPAGPCVGAVLQRLLAAVVDERLPNERAALLEAARKELPR